VGKRIIELIAHGETYKDVPGQRVAISEPTNRFYGVTYSKSHGGWHARLYLNGKQKSLGYFGFEVDAAICVNTHIAYLGLDRPLNAIPEDEMYHD
jgi:hypothetical protein